MAKDPEVPAEEAVEEFLGEGRINGSPAFKLAIANMIGGLAANAGGNTLATLAGQLISLHSSDPGGTTASATATELTGGGYAKKAVTWNPATGGVGNANATITGNPITFDVPAATISHFGVWEGGEYLYGKALNPAVTLSTAGKVTVTPSHSYGLNA